MDEAKKRVDRRVIKTKRAIRNAFVGLLSQKPIEQITVKELALAADVDRKTIYNYYDGLNAVLDELENEMLSDFEREAYALIGESRPQAFFEAITRLIESNMELYGLLLCGNNVSLVNKMVVFLRSWIAETVNRSGRLPSEKVALFCEYITSGIVSAYRYWFLSEEKLSLEEYSKELCSLVVGGATIYMRNE